MFCFGIFGETDEEFYDFAFSCYINFICILFEAG